MDLSSVLTPPKTIAIIGLSDKPDRPSYQVAAYLLKQGFTVIPINPLIKTIFGIPSYPSISSVPDDMHIDIVDIFRAPNHVIPILEEVMQTKRQAVIWLQEGVGSPESEEFAKQHGMMIVSNRCIMKQHQTISS